MNPRPPTILWRVQVDASRAFLFTRLASSWRWRLDEPNAAWSSAHSSYPAAMAEARYRHGLPSIGPAGEHIPAPAKEEAAT